MAKANDLLMGMGAGTGGGQGGQAPTLEKIRVGMAHPGNFSQPWSENFLAIVCQ